MAKNALRKVWCHINERAKRMLSGEVGVARAELLELSGRTGMTRSPRFYLLLVAWSLMTAARAVAADDLATRVDAFVGAEMTRQKIPGVAVAILQHGDVKFARGYGVANVEHMVPVSVDTIFQSGSVGKQFTAMLVLLLVEDGKLALSDPLAKFFPNAPPEWREITLRNLLTHTSGIPDYEKEDFDLQRNYTVDEVLAYAFGQKLEFAPGTRWNYSNTGYVLLGFVIEKVAGSNYGDLMRERVFAPTGMTTARIISETDIVPHRAAGYKLVKGELKNQDWVSPLLDTTGDGCIYWSLTDCIAWEKAWRARAVLKPASWAQMLTPVKLKSGRSYPYGFGIFVDRVHGQPVERHSGSWQGFKAYRAFYPEEDMSVIVLANLEQAEPTTLGEGLAALASPRLAAHEVPLAHPDPAIIARARQWIEQTAAGTLPAADFAGISGFVPTRADALRTRIANFGEPRSIQLMEQKDLGDDERYRFEVIYAAKTVRFIVDLGPNGKISYFNLTPNP